MERAGIDPVTLARGLVDIDSTTGREGEAGAWLAGALGAIGFEVTAQPVSGERFNVFATCGAPPQVVLSTHFDCVPPFFPSRLEGNRLYGRGSCDAKGILAAQVAAVDALRRAGEHRVGLLFVVGEERGSDGARAANAAAPRSCRYLVDGEPTDNRLGVATRGILRIRLKASGRAAHSSYPELGESAIDKLLDALVSMRQLSWPSDAELGRTHYTVGLIAGGIAPNVVSPAAEAEITFRTVSDASAVREVMAALEGHVALEPIHTIPPVRMATVDGFDTAVFPYATDIPFLDRWGQPLLYGPGSIHVAHTADEFIDLDELRAAVGGYQRIARELLARAD